MDIMDIIEGFRKVVQDLLVPELKAVQVEVKHLAESVKENSAEIKELRQEMNKRFEGVFNILAELRETQGKILA
ncbi:MAG: hypothetical protein AB1393_01140 [Candidatus Edwardsbacteria bacterium]